MKKIFISFFLVACVTRGVAQSFPCISDYKITIVNNGGGNCPDTMIDGQLQSATGRVTLTFDADVDPNNLPLIMSVTSLDSNEVVSGIAFGAGTLNNKGTVSYCYYFGPNNNNNLKGRNGQFRFNIAYYLDGTLHAGCGDQIPLPVDFKSFSAVRSNRVVSLKWISASESQNLGFEVQRLIGVGNWQTITFIPSQAVANNPSELTYAFADENPTRGVSQYRIKQLDIDQNAKYSEIRAVRGLGQMAKTIVYPNPSLSGSKVNILFDERDGIRDVSLIDMSGRIIRQWKGFANNNLQIEKLLPGLYSLRFTLRETGEQSIEKIVVN